MKKTSLRIFSTLLPVASLLFPTAVAAQGKAWAGSCVGTTNTLAGDVATIQGFTCLVANALNVILTIFAFVGFGMFIYGSLMYLLSGGQASKIEKAKSTFTYAIIGLVLAIAAFVLVNLISVFMGIDSMLTIKFLGNTV